ncbi:MAG: nuclear transport factor 2 family protein, partial [Pseudomonadota bacterium]
TDRAEVEKADDAFFSALNEMFTGNIKPMEALWSHADDVIYLGPVPELFHIGWKVTDQDWAAQGTAHLGGSINVVKRHMVIGKDLAVVHHLAEASGQGTEKAAIRMRGTNVFRKEDGAWKLIAHHSDPLPYVAV